MNDYSKALEFFIENNISLNSDQIDSLQEMFHHIGTRMKNKSLTKKADKIDKSVTPEVQTQVQNINKKFLNSTRHQVQTQIQNNKKPNTNNQALLQQQTNQRHSMMPTPV